MLSGPFVEPGTPTRIAGPRKNAVRRLKKNAFAALLAAPASPPAERYRISWGLFPGSRTPLAPSAKSLITVDCPMFLDTSLTLCQEAVELPRLKIAELLLLVER
jgi:hypothetical protein